MKDKKKNNNKDGDNSGQQAFIVVGLILSAAIMKFEAQIRFWLYDNLMMLVLAGISLLGLTGFYLWHRYKRKESEFFEKQKALRQIKPQFDDEDYYKPKRGC